MQTASTMDRGETEEMARLPVDQLKIAAHVAALKAGLRGDGIDAFLAILEADKGMTAAEVIEIARQVVGGIRPSSKKAAFLKMRQERLRIASNRDKGNNATKSTMW
jgi:hypothetical protein